MKNLFFVFILLLCVNLLFNSCQKEMDNNPMLATVTGVMHAANDNKKINHVFVYIDADGVRYSTYSKEDGSFSLMAPAGNQTICMQTGDGSLFHTCVDLSLEEDKTFAMPESETELKLNGSLAYIAGAYDKIEEIVHDTLGYPITEIFDADLMDTALLATFDAVFMNCNYTVLLPQAAYDNLATFVANGNSVYVSDFAVSYLLGEYNGTCVRSGGFIDDSLLCTLKMGPATTIPGTSIIDTAFQSYMGTTTMDVAYDLGGWEVVQNYNTTFWNTIVSDATYGPLMLRNQSLGAGSGGKIYYTTFHNEPNGLIGVDMRHMLEYVILNL